MWLTLTEEANQTWFAIELLTLSYPYETVQSKIAKTLSPFANAVKRYSEVTERPIQLLTEKYIEEHPEVAEQNIALLKNAIELWKTATRTSDAIAPLLVHYSWHCFNSFFVYSFFRWEPQHSKSHGIGIELADRLEDMKIQVFKYGLFRRIIDTWTIIGVPLIFSPFLPFFSNDEMHFQHNEMYLCEHSNEISLEALMRFKPVNFEKELHSKRREDLVVCPFLANSIYLPNRFLKNYLLLFVASSIARYRPILWHSILKGKGKFGSEFFVETRDAVLDYVLGKHRGLNLVFQIARILKNIEKETFFLRNRKGDIIKNP